MLINVNILCFINIGIPCKHLFGSFTASAIKSQHRTFFNINKNSQQIIFYDLRCESLFRMYEFLWNTWLIFSSVTVQYLTVTRKNPFQIGCADRIFAFQPKFSYGQRSKCADLRNSYYFSIFILFCLWYQSKQFEKPPASTLAPDFRPFDPDISISTNCTFFHNKVIICLLFCIRTL